MWPHLVSVEEGDAVLLKVNGSMQNAVVESQNGDVLWVCVIEDGKPISVEVPFDPLQLQVMKQKGGRAYLLFRDPQKSAEYDLTVFGEDALMEELIAVEGGEQSFYSLLRDHAALTVRESSSARRILTRVITQSSWHRRPAHTLGGAAYRHLIGLLTETDAEAMFRDDSLLAFGSHGEFVEWGVARLSPKTLVRLSAGILKTAMARNPRQRGVDHLLHPLLMRLYALAPKRILSLLDLIPAGDDSWHAGEVLQYVDNRKRLWNHLVVYERRLFEGETCGFPGTVYNPVLAKTPLNHKYVAALVQDVVERGEPSRAETIFRALMHARPKGSKDIPIVIRRIDFLELLADRTYCMPAGFVTSLVRALVALAKDS